MSELKEIKRRENIFLIVEAIGALILIGGLFHFKAWTDWRPPNIWRTIWVIVSLILVFVGGLGYVWYREKRDGDFEYSYSYDS